MEKMSEKELNDFITHAAEYDKASSAGRKNLGSEDAVNKAMSVLTEKKVEIQTNFKSFLKEKMDIEL